MTVDEKRKMELDTMRQIMGMYCQNKHNTQRVELFDECQAIWSYAKYRVAFCPHM